MRHTPRIFTQAAMVASISVDAISVDIGAVIYPDCDDQPMSDNTKQLRSPRDNPCTLDKKSR